MLLCPQSFRNYLLSLPEFSRSFPEKSLPTQPREGEEWGTRDKAYILVVMKIVTQFQDGSFKHSKICSFYIK